MMGGVHTRVHVYAIEALALYYTTVQRTDPASALLEWPPIPGCDWLHSAEVYTVY